MSTSINSLFGNSNMFGTSSTNSASSSSSILGDYASIKNGSYKKLLNAYYKNQESDSTSKTSGSKGKEVPSELKLLKGDSSELSSSLSKLTSGKSNLFDKVTKTSKNENGEEVTTTDYDRDAILSAVKSFADSYNSTIKDSAESDNLSVLRKAAIMTKSTAANQGLLNDVGIKVGKDNSLSIDEDKLKSADISKLKTLFQGYGSYASGIQQKASDISGVANQMITKATHANGSMYTNNGNYSTNLGSFYDKLF